MAWSAGGTIGAGAGPGPGAGAGFGLGFFFGRFFPCFFGGFLEGFFFFFLADAREVGSDDVRRWPGTVVGATRPGGARTEETPSTIFHRRQWGRI